MRSRDVSARYLRGRAHVLRSTKRFLPKARWLNFVTAIAGASLAGGAAYGVGNWAVGLGAGSSGEAQSATVSNLSITATATPAASNVLYPGGNGDVVVTISNPNPFPVTITAMGLPTNTTYAGGFTTSGLATGQTGCSSTASDVIWNYSTATSGSSHALATALIVGASGQSNNPLVVTLTNDASMTASAPAACEGTYFSDALVDRHHRHRRSGDFHHDPDHRQLDELIAQLGNDRRVLSFVANLPGRARLPRSGCSGAVSARLLPYLRPTSPREGRPRRWRLDAAGELNGLRIA